MFTEAGQDSLLPASSAVSFARHLWDLDSQREHVCRLTHFPACLLSVSVLSVSVYVLLVLSVSGSRSLIIK